MVVSLIIRGAILALITLIASVPVSATALTQEVKTDGQYSEYSRRFRKAFGTTNSCSL